MTPVSGTAALLGVMFPGQGTQRLGMGRWMERGSEAAAAVFDTAAEVLGRDVRALCFSGPARELTLTQNAQVAVFTVNAAAAALLRAEGYEPQLAMGHSVGELNALVAAGVLELADGLRLVAARGELMGRIAAPGTMAAVVGLQLPDVARLCGEATAAARADDPAAVVVPALLNGPENVVVSGSVTAVERAEQLASEAGARKVTRLVVSSAFHSPLMAEAVPEWREVVAAASLAEPRIPVVLNTTGAVATGAEDARQALVDQLTGPVRWVEDVRAAIAAGVGMFVEAGDSKTLATLVRGIEPGTGTLPMQDPRTIRKLRDAGGNLLAGVASRFIPAGPTMTARSRAVRLPDRGTVEDLLGGCPRSLVYSTAEQRYCGRRTDLTGWGGRLAAKLAVADVLGIDADAALAGHRDAGLAGIQILPARSGLCRHGPGCLRSHPPEVTLTSALREDNDVSVSISHTRAWAIALAVRTERKG